MAAADRCATFANFGGGYKDQTRPQIQKVVIAESIKRKLPSKHYVYKMIVEWSSGTTSIVYRRYSMFFDFQVKLQELYLAVCQKYPQVIEKIPHLPELPGKILFGRSHIHQVAEKRRGKIEEFCQQVVSLPAEISHTNLVMGFFNTWPDDTMLPQHSESVSSVSSSFTSSTLSTSRIFSPTSPTSPNTLTANHTPFSPPAATSATEAVISHPDEMENLEQYSVLADYHRKDSHQVNLSAGQVVHVIEKHDTGWWMVMSDDEQGYAPAAYLEPVDGNWKQPQSQEQQNTLTESVNMEDCEEYEAMESYSAQSDDEVAFNAGDKIGVISKSLDGWWKIRCNSKIGVAPSALIRKRMEAPQVPRDDVIYESHKSIYEHLNIHKPPPRRNTIGRSYNRLSFQQQVYAVPRANPPLVKMPTDPTLSTTTYNDEDSDHDYVEPPIELTSEDEEDPGYYRVPRPLQSSMSDTTYNKWNGSNSIYSPPPPSEHSDTTNHNSKLEKMESSSIDCGGGVYESVPEESPCEMEPGALTNDHLPPSSSAVYQNADDARVEAEAFKSSRSNSSELLNIISSSNTGQTDTSSSLSPVSITTTSPPPTQSNTPSSTTGPLRDSKVDDDYVDIDQHDEYVDPGELMIGAGGGGGGEGSSSAGESLPPTSPSTPFDLFKPLPKPPLPTSNPPKKKPQMNKSKSLSVVDDIEDEYIPMDPIYTQPPLEEPDLANTTDGLSTQQQQKQQQKQSNKTPTPSTPSSTTSTTSSFFSSSSPSPVSQGKQKKGYPRLKISRNKVQISSPVLVEMNGGLTKAKSLEDLLASNSSRESSPQRHGSPHSERKASPGHVPILPPFPEDGVSGKGKVGDESRSGGGGVTKQKLGKSKSGGGRGRITKRYSEIPPVPHHVLHSSSPPRGPSPEHRAISHTTSVPIPPPLAVLSGQQRQQLPPPPPQTKDSVHLKTYVALSNYQTSASSCLSFQAGDRCVLLRKTPDGWWLVNIGGREGWTPEAYWKEEAWNQTTTIARPAGPPPSVSPILPPDRKPRSHTVATDGVGVGVLPRQLELSSSMEGSLETSNSSWGGSVDIDQQSTTSGESTTQTVLDGGRKPTPPTPPPQNTKPTRRDPLVPRPKPYISTNNPQKRKGERKPPVPQKPSIISQSVVPGPKVTPTTAQNSQSTSPHLPRRRSEDTPSPPPPPVPPVAASLNKKLLDKTPRTNDDNNSSSNNSEYVMLENTHTLDPLESFSWFVGKMERVNAEQFLMEHGRQREFLVRERTAKDGYYALSIRYHYSCKHFNIDPTPQGQYLIGNLTFPAISDIVHHYQNNSLFIHENQHVTLSVPARRRTRGSIDIRTQNM